ncbi:hypothetical protein L1887_15083 [Cichorium endivia]|nr:hypothetical protein L1887_15083 [Cichorium endivia]
MQQRNSGNRRPSGTDGSDFSYRMVVDNRYTKVAKGKSTLSKVLAIQISVFTTGDGRKRSRVNLLKFYMVASSMGILGSILIGLGDWEIHEFDLLKIAYVFAASLIENMSPPKRAS